MTDPQTKLQEILDSMPDDLEGLTSLVTSLEKAVIHTQRRLMALTSGMPRAPEGNLTEADDSMLKSAGPMLRFLLTRVVLAIRAVTNAKLLNVDFDDVSLMPLIDLEVPAGRLYMYVKPMPSNGISFLVFKAPDQARLLYDLWSLQRFVWDNVSPESRVGPKPKVPPLDKSDANLGAVRHLREGPF